MGRWVLAIVLTAPVFALANVSSFDSKSDAGFYMQRGYSAPAQRSPKEARVLQRGYESLLDSQVFDQKDKYFEPGNSRHVRQARHSDAFSDMVDAGDPSSSLTATYLRQLNKAHDKEGLPLPNEAPSPHARSEFVRHWLGSVSAYPSPSKKTFSPGFSSVSAQPESERSSRSTGTQFESVATGKDLRSGLNLASLRKDPPSRFGSATSRGRSEATRLDGMRRNMSFKSFGQEMPKNHLESSLASDHMGSLSDNNAREGRDSQPYYSRGDSEFGSAKASHQDLKRSDSISSITGASVTLAPLSRGSSTVSSIESPDLLQSTWKRLHDYQGRTGRSFSSGVGDLMGWNSKT